MFSCSSSAVATKSKAYLIIYLTITIKKMKTTLKLILCAVAVTIFSAQCKAQGSHAQHVIDSLKITDGDEIKICKLYDDVVTEYMNEWQTYAAHNTKPTAAQSAEISKKFQAREQELKPQIEAFRKKVASNYPQMMNFVQFCSYESMRVYAIVTKYQGGMYKNYPTPANH
jgi:hypothetical protein